MSFVYHCVFNLTQCLAHNRCLIFPESVNRWVELLLRFYLETNIPQKQGEEEEGGGRGEEEGEEEEKKGRRKKKRKKEGEGL